MMEKFHNDCNWAVGSMVEHMLEAWGSIPSTKKRQEREGGIKGGRERGQSDSQSGIVSSQF